MRGAADRKDGGIPDFPPLTPTPLPLGERGLFPLAYALLHHLRGSAIMGERAGW